MKKLFVRYTLRLPPDVNKKIDIIADRNGRSRNREIEMTLKKYIVSYERENGPIITKNE